MNKKNLILGMVTALSLPAANVLHAEDAAPTAQQQSAPAYLGIVVGPVPQVVQAQLPEDVAQGQGLMVMRVMPDSPAAADGLKSHDVLLTLDGKKLIAPDDLVSNISSKTAGEKIKLEVLRHGKVKGIEVTLAAQKRYQPESRRPPFPQQMMPHRSPMPDARSEVRVEESFESIAVNRLPNGKYKAMIEFLDQDGNMKKFEYEGSKDELAEQINKEKDLPGPQKDQLLNALGGNAVGFPMRGFPAFPDMQDIERDFFSPPPWARPHRQSFWD